MGRDGLKRPRKHVKYKSLEEKYIVGKTLGEGTFGKVRKGIHRISGVKVAIKILVKKRITDAADVERVRREIKILKEVQHANIIKLFEVIDTSKYIFLIMEFVAGGELFDHIVKKQRLGEFEACRFFHHIINGVEYCHKRKIVHRDLKPENLLLEKKGSNQTIKIVDFGLGNHISHDELMRTACGSPCYAAPEMIAGHAYVGYGVDVWSMGIILFALLCGFLPFEHPNTNELYKQILRGHFQVSSWVSKDAKDLLHKILCTDPKRRYKIRDIKKHPWYARAKVYTPRTEKSDVPDTLNEVIVQQMELAGFSREKIKDSINSRRHDSIYATYHLLEIRQKRKLCGGMIAGLLSTREKKTFKTYISPRKQETLSSRNQKYKSRIQQQYSTKPAVPPLSLGKTRKPQRVKTTRHRTPERPTATITSYSARRWKNGRHNSIRVNGISAEFTPRPPETYSKPVRRPKSGRNYIRSRRKRKPIFAARNQTD